MAATTIKPTRSDRIFDVWNYALLTIFFIIVLYPLVYVASASFSNPDAVISGQMWLLPVQPTLDGYRAVFSYESIVQGYLNSVFYVVAGTVVNVFMTILAGYALSRRDLYGRNMFMFLFVFTTLFSGGLIPTYLVVDDVGLLNTRWALIVPTALAVYNVIITRTFFQVTIPHELLEAAQIDGSDDFTFLRRVVLPLSGPIIAVNVLFYAIGHWNQFFSALIYLTNESLFPLQLVLREILVQNSVDPSQMSDATELLRRQHLRDLLKYSLIVVASLPPLMLYPFVQKYFVKGLIVGSLKG